MQRILETKRLYLRELTDDDFEALYAVLSDSDIMQHYPYTFDAARVRGWIDKNKMRYMHDGFGLWAVCLNDTGKMIGDCGLTLQRIDGQLLPEIGYHLRHDCQHRGYAREAASAVMDWAFANTAFMTLYSYCKYTNIPSIRTAEAIGMHFLKEYTDEAQELTHVSAVSRREWQALKRNAVKVKAVDADNFSKDSLDSFDRFQTVTNVYRLIGGELILQYAPFTETWSAARKREKAVEILSGKYLTFCAFDSGRIVGEIMLVPELDKHRLIIDSFHVSRDRRRCGIGRMLFEAAREEALRRGAVALYLSACSAQETIDFYTALGFLPSEDPIPFYVQDEPCDIQMECRLKQ